MEQDDDALGASLGPVKAAWQLAVERACVEFKHGDTIPRAWLEAQFGIAWPEQMSRAEAQRISLRFFGEMHAFSNTMLREHKMALEANNRGGWLIVPPGLQHMLALGQLRRGIDRAFVRAAVVLEHTRTDLLSQEEAQARRETQAKIANFEMVSKRTLEAPASVAKSTPGEGES